MLPVEVVLTYTDAAVANMDEESLFWAVRDEHNGEWVAATETCASVGTIVRDPAANRITVTTCAAGEFALLGQATGGFQVYLPFVIR